MPVRSFFAMRKAGYQVEARFLTEAVMVAAVPMGSKEYAQDLRATYAEKYLGEKLNKPVGGKVFDAADPNTATAIINFLSRH